ncbi:hypothetical protein AWJ20_1815 [Sugiyamaella lignohabitans]|uniref:Uncharacterized protein n=1 Tax=Sugiyamaella lignohabitans TaxID=796027 RepID=A0A167E0X7_9ASCO|nr:uncharacterized protein AWJ20_1815 [Sugiyamaella lignohabitans]ANB13520.1 hypothetical protein AWJ20_1815 [Sugiyamaella lignohabitans]
MNIETQQAPHGPSQPHHGVMGPYGTTPMAGNGQLPKANDKELLNLYIYDYLVKHNLVESARSFNREAEFGRSNGSRTSTPNTNDRMNGLGERSPSMGQRNDSDLKGNPDGKFLSKTRLGF